MVPIQTELPSPTKWCHGKYSSKIDIDYVYRGDQLTHERFSGSKRNRINARIDQQAFSHIGPITFELFHFQMAALSVVFKHLFKEDSVDQPCTMKAQAERTGRKHVEENVKKSFQPNRDFTLLFVKSYIEEVVLDYFGMEDGLSHPTKHAPPMGKEERQIWLKEHFGALLDKHVFQKIPTAPQTVQGKLFDYLFMSYGIFLLYFSI